MICPYCKSEINNLAVKCPQCTGNIEHTEVALLDERTAGKIAPYTSLAGGVALPFALGYAGFIENPLWFIPWFLVGAFFGFGLPLMTFTEVSRRD